LPNGLSEGVAPVSVTRRILPLSERLSFASRLISFSPVAT
jgi:hypothetical protein